MILVYGTICLDRIQKVPYLPQSGGYTEVTSQEDHLGGEAMNTSTALKIWGTDIRLSGNPIGKSPRADWIIEQAQRRNLPINEIPKVDGPLPVCEIYVTPDGDRTIFGFGFNEAAKLCQPQKLDLKNVDWLTLDSGNRESSDVLISQAKELGIRIYAMDLLPNEKLPPNSFWQTSSDSIGRRGDIQKNVNLVKKMVKEQDVLCIHSDGANGFVAGGPNQPVRHYPPFPAESVVDTTGAGDCFRAGMLFGLNQNWPNSKSFQFASAAGCLNCRAFGATDGIPAIHEVEELIAKNPQIARSYE